MTQTLTTPNPQPPWWNAIGDAVYRVTDRDPMVITLSSKFGHLKIRKDGRKNDLFHVQSIMFAHGNLRSDIERLLDGGELQTMFQSKQFDFRVTDKDYCERFALDFGIPGKFALLDDMVSFPSVGTGCLGDPNFLFRLKPFMTEAVDRLVRTGSTGRI
jgi:hypothetical protein